MKTQGVSRLGFGCMRFPLIPGTDRIDEAETEKMIDYAYAGGVNYFDTAWPYHGGESENVIGRILSKYPRESFFLADKMPSWKPKTLKEAKAIFEEQLRKCRTTYFDFYLLHSLWSQEDYEKLYDRCGVLDCLLSEQSAGRIGKLGFSFHGNAAFLEHLLKLRRWDFVQLQLNYMDWDIYEARKLHELAVRYETPVIVMEPVRGGALARLNPSGLDVLREAAPERSPASWALRFAASLPGVLTVLSGMSSFEQTADNMKTLLSSWEPLKDDGCAVLKTALDAYMKARPIPCTVCRYCLPCPFGVNIPKNFMVCNEVSITGNLPDLNAVRDDEFKRRQEAFLRAFENVELEEGPQNCVDCGRCVKLCPQHIPIPEKLKAITELLTELA